MFTPVNTRLLFLLGLLTVAAAQITSHFSQLGELSVGALHGVGIGLLLVVLYSVRRRNPPRVTDN